MHNNDILGCGVIVFKDNEWGVPLVRCLWRMEWNVRPLGMAQRQLSSGDRVYRRNNILCSRPLPKVHTYIQDEDHELQIAVTQGELILESIV